MMPAPESAGPTTREPPPSGFDVVSDAGRLHLRWALTDGIGPVLFTRILSRFGDAATALGASASALQQISGIGRERADRIARETQRIDVEAEIGACADHRVRIVCREDPDYPPGLKQIPDAPIVLYVRGDLRPTDALSLAVVGSRRCTIYGSEQARRFGELLAGAGFTVVSGLARGIDAFAHHGAVDAGGRSIAVMGSGLHEVYPPENRPLADKMLEAGAWISELPIRTAVRAGNFPSRNRIIAGMTLGTLVVEAALTSGALITARLASEYNREVFAVPGRVQDPMSAGANALIRDGGAKLVTCLDDIRAELGEVGRLLGGDAARACGRSPSAESAGPAGPASLTAVEARVYELIGREPLLQDAILAQSGDPPGEVLSAMTALELKGLVRRLPGSMVMRTPPRSER